MPTAWPPSTAPAWPPPGWTQLTFSSMSALVSEIRSLGGTDAAPTGTENTKFFTSARCDDGHAVVGRMVVLGGVRYPFAGCNNAAHRQFLVLWPPFTGGDGMGV
jgi:hypothetical protein